MSYSIFDLRAYVTTRREEVCAFAWRESIQQFPDFLPEGLDISPRGFAEPSLEFGKELFVRVQIRRIGWQEEHPGSGREGP